MDSQALCRRESAEHVTALAIFACVNIIFLLKYLMRVDASGFAAILASLLYAGFICLVARRKIRKVSDTAVVTALAIYSLAFIILMQTVPIDRFEIDRWKIIRMFWQAVEQGGYPYAARMPGSGNMPGASPVYFLISYPFYRFGLYELMAISVPWIWWFGFRKRSRAEGLKALLLICTAPSFLYEIVTRSTLWFNSILILVYCASLFNFRKWDMKTLIANAILGGLLLNTRTIYVIPYFVIWFSLCRDRQNIKRGLIWGLTAALTYILVFAVMAMIWGGEEVIADNPFTVQGANLYPAWFMALLVCAAIVAGLFTRDGSRMFISGILMFASTLFYAVLVVISYGFREAFVDSYADITYFCFCLPFLLYAGLYYCESAYDMPERLTR